MKKILLLFLFASCYCIIYGQKNVPIMQKNSTGKEHQIDIYSAIQKAIPILSLSQIAKDIEFVPLETTDECLLDQFLKDIVITNNDIFVFDYTKCYHFNRKGKFLNGIGVKGQGPGEYTKAMAISVDTINKWIYLSDNRTQRLLKYDYAGKYLKTIKINISSKQNYLNKPGELILENDNYGFEKSGKRYSLYLYSETKNIFLSKMACEWHGKIPSLAMWDPIVCKHNNALYLLDFWSDTIYQYKSPIYLESHAVLKKGKFINRTIDDKSLLTGKEDIHDRMTLGVNRMSETDRYILLSTNRGNIIYDKKTRTTIAGGFDEKTKTCVTDDLYGGSGIRSDHFPCSSKGDELYTFRYTYELIEAAKAKHLINDSRYIAYQNMLKKLGPENNPVIMIIKLKK